VIYENCDIFISLYFFCIVLFNAECNCYCSKLYVCTRRFVKIIPSYFNNCCLLKVKISTCLLLANITTGYFGTVCHYMTPTFISFFNYNQSLLWNHWVKLNQSRVVYLTWQTPLSSKMGSYFKWSKYPHVMFRLAVRSNYAFWLAEISQENMLLNLDTISQLSQQGEKQQLPIYVNGLIWLRKVTPIFLRYH